MLSTSLTDSVDVIGKPIKVEFTVCGESGAYIEPFVNEFAKHEREVLYMPETKFHVLQNRMDDGILKIVMREIR